MKRDMELVRQILFKVEADAIHPEDWIEDFEFEGYDPQTISNHVWLLGDAGFLLTMKNNALGDEFVCHPMFLTWKGVEFLDSIRDQDVWDKTKKGLATAGVAGIDFAWGIAKEYAKARVFETLGMKL
jgi:hypothetical protein